MIDRFLHTIPLIATSPSDVMTSAFELRGATRSHLDTTAAPKTGLKLDQISPGGGGVCGDENARQADHPRECAKSESATSGL